MQLVVPPELRKEILFMLHSHKSAGHLGIAKTLGKLRQRFYWPGYKADVERWCKHCKVYASINPGPLPTKAPLQQKPVYRRMDRIACDIMGPVETSDNGNSYILVVGDYVSKFTEAYPIPDMLVQTVCDVLSREWICRYGCPVVLHSDQGRNFESELFQQLCTLWEVHKTRTSRYRPNSDGMIERCNRSIKKMLRAFTDENPKSWEDHLPYIMMAYRATDQSSTHTSPNLLLFGEENRLPVDLMYADCSLEQDIPHCPQQYIEWVRDAARSAFTSAQKHLKQSAQRQKRLYDKNTHLRKFLVGNWVWILHPPSQQKKFGRGWQGPFLIVQKLGDVNYVVQRDEESRRITLHVDHIKPYIHDDTPENWLKSKDQTNQTEIGVQVNLPIANGSINIDTSD
jgi:transposase InsO family protein